jgi:hypothetical protein
LSSDFEFFALQPFRQLLCRAAYPTEITEPPPAKTTPMVIVQRGGFVVHRFNVRQPFHMPTSDAGVSSLLSALTSTTGPREPRQRAA